MSNGNLSSEPDATAPDGSEIRLAGEVGGGSLCECTLSVGQMSSAVKHNTIEEIWLFTKGSGEVWRQMPGQQEELVKVGPGSWLTIPVGVHFQFRNIGDEPLKFVISTIPPWPGEDEAVSVDDHWPAK